MANVIDYDDARNLIEQWAEWSRRDDPRTGYPNRVSFARFYRPNEEDMQDCAPEVPRHVISDDEAGRIEAVLVMLCNTAKIVLASRYLASGYLKDNANVMRMTHNELACAVDAAIREFVGIWNLDKTKMSA